MNSVFGSTITNGSLTLFGLIVLQFVIILKHWNIKIKKEDSEAICPHFLVGNEKKDAPTYVSEDRRYKKWEDNWDG